MSYSYDKRRAASVGHKDQQFSGHAPTGTFLPDASNSAQIAMLGYHDTPRGAEALKAAMDAKAASLIGGRSVTLGRFGPDYENAQAEAEADRIGSRFSGATGVKDLINRMSSALGADFSDVRFHTGADASAMASESDAEAFTTGRDIYLGGPFNAATAAHEVVHTIQQGAVEASAPVMSAPAGSVQFKKDHKHHHKHHHKNGSSTPQGTEQAPAPAASEPAAPAASETTAPAASETTAPAASTTAIPAASGTTTPAASTTAALSAGATAAAARTLAAPKKKKHKHTPAHWVKKKTLGAHQDAMDQFIENREDYNKMSAGRRFLWSARNPLARIRGRSSVGEENEGYKARKLQRLREDRVSDALAKRWQDENGHYSDDVMGYANPEFEPQSSGKSKQGKGAAAVEGLADAVDKANGDLDTETGLNTIGTPLEALDLAGNSMKIDLDRKGLTGPDIKLPSGVKGMKTAVDIGGKVGGAVSTASDVASFAKNSMAAHRHRKQGNFNAAFHNATDASADLVSGTGTILSMTPIGPAGVIGSSMSAMSNTMKAINSADAAGDFEETQEKMAARQEKYEQQEAALRAKDTSGMNDQQKAQHRYMLSRGRIAKQIKDASRINKIRSNVSTASSTVKAVSNTAAAALGGAALVATGGTLDPVSGIVNSVGTTAAAVTEGAGNAYARHEKRKMRTETVNDEIHLDEKIDDLEEQLHAANPQLLHELGLTKNQAVNMSRSEIKHIVLKSMGFKTGKRKEAFNQITMRRAKELADRANTYDPNDASVGKEERDMMNEMFLSKDSTGKFNTAAIAEMMGYEDMDDEDNPFEKHVPKTQNSDSGGGSQTPAATDTATSSQTPDESPGARDSGASSQSQNAEGHVHHRRGHHHATDSSSQAEAKKDKAKSSSHHRHKAADESPGAREAGSSSHSHRADGDVRHRSHGHHSHRKAATESPGAASSGASSRSQNAEGNVRHRRYHRKHKS